MKIKIPKKYIVSKKKMEKEKCIACNGTGYYDTTNSPPCSACNGTGKQK